MGATSSNVFKTKSRGSVFNSMTRMTSKERDENPYGLGANNLMGKRRGSNAQTLSVADIN